MVNRLWQQLLCGLGCKLAACASSVGRAHADHQTDCATSWRQRTRVVVAGHQRRSDSAPSARQPFAKHAFQDLDKLNREYVLTQRSETALSWFRLAL